MTDRLDDLWRRTNERRQQQGERLDSFWSMLVGAVLIGVGLGIAQFEGYLDSRED